MAPDMYYFQQTFYNKTDFQHPYPASLYLEEPNIIHLGGVKHGHFYTGFFKFVFIAHGVRLRNNALICLFLFVKKTSNRFNVTFSLFNFCWDY